MIHTDYKSHETQKNRAPAENEPLVSVVLATYNGEQFLREQLDSIVNQSYRKLEILVQDDRSTDSTLSILCAYETRDSRICVQQNQINLGINKNFYDLIEKANGEYIAISDQDDVWDLHKIETLLDKIGNHSLIYTDSHLIDKSGRPMGETLLKRNKLLPRSGRFMTNFLSVNVIAGHACLFNKSILSSIRSFNSQGLQFSYSYDALIGTIASFHGGIKFFDRELTFHRLHETNNCHKFNLKKKKDRFLHFLSRKQRRVERILLEKKRRRLFMTHIFDICLSSSPNPFTQEYFSYDKYSHRVFSFRLYQSLVTLGINRKEASSLSLGNYFYLILRLF